MPAFCTPIAASGQAPPMGVQTVPPSDAEALRAYIGALNEFLSMAQQAADSDRPIGSNPELDPRWNALLKTLKDSRGSAIVAGRHCGAIVESLGNSLSACERACHGHIGSAYSLR